MLQSIRLIVLVRTLKLVIFPMISLSLSYHISWNCANVCTLSSDLRCYFLACLKLRVRSLLTENFLLTLRVVMVLKSSISCALIRMLRCLIVRLNFRLFALKLVDSTFSNAELWLWCRLFSNVSIDCLRTDLNWSVLRDHLINHRRLQIWSCSSCLNGV